MTLWNKSIKGLLISFLCALASWASAQHASTYIRHFADIAVSEMHSHRHSRQHQAA